MNVVAFAGPSLTAPDRAAFPGITWRPPAEAGDLLRLPIGDTATVCLIDGYFDHRPAVRHKEILLLLSEGVRIFGASSIGALRAAEMHGFGMIGVGAVFSAYLRGSLLGDDEVALIHAGPDRNWQPASIPLVDVRAALCQARRRRLIGRGPARALLKAAAAIHYIDRDWRSIGAAAEAEPGVEAFLVWAERDAPSQKREDALACLRAAASPAGIAPTRPPLVRTCFLNALERECREVPALSR